MLGLCHWLLFSTAVFCVTIGSFTCMLGHFSMFDSLQTVAHQAPLCMEFSRQEYCSELLCPPPGNLSNLGPNPSLYTVSYIGRQVPYYQCHLGSLLAPLHVPYGKCENGCYSHVIMGVMLRSLKGVS